MILQRIIFLSIVALIRATIFFPIKEPQKAMRNNTGIYQKYDSSRKPFQKYIGIRVASTSKAMEAIVAI